MPGSWEEAKHPRAGDGKFGEGGGGAAPAPRAAKPAPKPAARPTKAARARAAAVSAKARTLVSDARGKAKAIVAAAAAKRSATLAKAKSSGRKLTPVAKAKIATARAKAKDRAKAIVEKAKARAAAMKAKSGATGAGRAAPAGAGRAPPRARTKSASNASPAAATPSRPVVQPRLISKEEHQSRAAAVDQLPEPERRAVRDYQGLSYEEINPALRSSGGAIDGPLGEEVKRIDSAISKSKLPHDQKLFRSMRGDDVMNKFAGMRAGQKFVDHGFSSTASDPSGSAGFGRTSLVISAPKGASALHMPGGEREVILPRGSRFRVDKVDHGSISVGGSPVPTLQVHVTLLQENR